MISLNFDLVKCWLFSNIRGYKVQNKVSLFRTCGGNSDTCFRGRRRYNYQHSLILEHCCPCHRSSTLISSQFLFPLVLFPQTLCNQESFEFLFFWPQFMSQFTFVESIIFKCIACQHHTEIFWSLAFYHSVSFMSSGFVLNFLKFFCYSDIRSMKIVVLLHEIAVEVYKHTCFTMPCFTALCFLYFVNITVFRNWGFVTALRWASLSAPFLSYSICSLCVCVTFC